MQVLIDTNVILDVLMQRPGMEFSGRILVKSEVLYLRLQ